MRNSHVIGLVNQSTIHHQKTLDVLDMMYLRFKDKKIIAIRATIESHKKVKLIANITANFFSSNIASCNITTTTIKNYCNSIGINDN